MSRPLTMPRLTEITTTRAAALKLAAAGWAVLPVRTGKHPGSVVGNGWQHQSTVDPAVINAWWDENEEYGIALHAGKCGDHGVVVVDVDYPDLVPDDWWPLLKKARYHRSNSHILRKGHYFFLNPPGKVLTNSKHPWGEIKTGNGVVIAPPSRHAKAASGGRYRQIRAGVVPPLPAAIAEHLDERKNTSDKSVTHQEVKKLIAQYNSGRKLIKISGQCNLYYNKVAEEGESRHDSMFQALRWGLQEAIVGDYPAQALIDRLFREWNDSLDYKGRYKGILRDERPDRAAAYGEFRDLVKDTMGIAMANVERDAAKEEDELEEAEPFQYLRGPLKSADIKAMKPTEWLIDGWLENAGVTMLIGATGTNKSFTVLDWMLSLAFGVPWLGNGVRKRVKSFLVVGEGAQGLPKRLEAWRQEHDIPEKKFWATYDRYIHIEPKPKKASLRDEALWEEITDAAMGHGAKLVTLDTFSSLAPNADEVKDAPMIVNQLTELAGAVGGMAMLAHHTGWNNLDRARNASQWEANPDSVLIAQKVGDEKNLVKLWVKKNKDDETEREIHIVRKIVNLGFDKEGKPITSVVLEEAGKPDGTTLRLQVWDAVHALVGGTGAQVKKGDIFSQLNRSAQSPASRPYHNALDSLVATACLTFEQKGQAKLYGLGANNPRLIGKGNVT